MKTDTIFSLKKQPLKYYATVTTNIQKQDETNKKNTSFIPIYMPKFITKFETSSTAYLSHEPEYWTHNEETNRIHKLQH